MSRPIERNRLDEEESPYLTQHADNPVNWQPWDDTALDAAAELDRPIFLSIGYAACHWCHVMEDESFMNDAIAERLNDHFVPIKVDREERPDVDSVYMTACQVTTGRGGWPLSAWLTPDGRPFQLGTYFPPEPKRGMPGFGDLLDDIAESWETDRDGIETRAEQVTAAVRRQLEETSEAPAAGSRSVSNVLESAADAVRYRADREHGGFGSGNKFPQPSRLHALFRAYDRTGNEAYRTVALEALDAMARGGLVDHVGGGFHRYCVDEEWTVPHFEKMLYDNAELPRAYLTGYQLTGDETYARVVRDTLSFVERELTHEAGGFYSTLDAQSETSSGTKAEGAFYVWTPTAVHDALETERDAELWCERFGVTAAGNFEGRTVPNVTRSVPELATAFDLDEAAVRDRLARATTRLREHREQRPRPARDEKILAGWNGMAIAAFAEAAVVLDDDHFADVAVDALEFVRSRLWDEQSARLARRYKDGDVAVDGYLDDYAFLARGALACYEATGEVDHLAFALDLARAIVAEFWSADDGTLYFTPERAADLVTRPQELTDGSTPAAAGVAAETLLALAPFTSAEFETVVETLLSTHASRIEESPLKYVTLAQAADRFETGMLEITVAADAMPDEWLRKTGERYLPDGLVTMRPPSEERLESWLDALDLGSVPPVWADRVPRDGAPTVYVCREFTCSPPYHDIDEALDWLSTDAGEDGA